MDPTLRIRSAPLLSAANLFSNNELVLADPGNLTVTIRGYTWESEIPLPLDEWHYLVLTRKDKITHSDVWLYIDGEPVAYTLWAPGGTLEYRTGRPVLWAGPDGASVFLPAAMDSPVCLGRALVYGRALTTDMVKQRYLHDPDRDGIDVAIDNCPG